MLLRTIGRMESEERKRKNLYAYSVLSSISAICLKNKTSKLIYSEILIEEISNHIELSKLIIKRTIDLLIKKEIIIQEDDEIYIPEVKSYFDSKKLRNQREKRYYSQKKNPTYGKSQLSEISSGKNAKNDTLLDNSTQNNLPTYGNSQLSEISSGKNVKNDTLLDNSTQNNLPTYGNSQLSEILSGNMVKNDTLLDNSKQNDLPTYGKSQLSEILSGNMAKNDTLLDNSKQNDLPTYGNSQLSEILSGNMAKNDTLLDNSKQNDLPTYGNSQLSEISSGKNAKNVTLLDNSKQNDLPTYGNSQLSEISSGNNAKNVTLLNQNEEKSILHRKNSDSNQVSSGNNSQNVTLLNQNEEKSNLHCKNSQSDQILSGKNAKNDTLLDEEKETYSIYDDGSRAEGDILTNYERKYRINWWRFQPKELLKMSNYDIHNRVMDKDLPQSNIEYMLMRNEKLHKHSDSDKYYPLLIRKMTALFGECRDLDEFRKLNKAQAIKQRNLALARHFNLPYEVVRLINSHNHPFEFDYFGSNYDFIEKNLEALRELDLEKLPKIVDAKNIPAIINEETLYKFFFIYKYNLYKLYKENNKISESTKQKIENSEKSFPQLPKSEKNHQVKKEVINETPERINDFDDFTIDKIKEEKKLLIGDIYEVYDIEEKINSYSNLAKIYVTDKHKLNSLMKYQDLTIERFEKVLEKLNKWVGGKSNVDNFWALFFTFLKKEAISSKKKDKK